MNFSKIVIFGNLFFLGLLLTSIDVGLTVPITSYGESIKKVFVIDNKIPSSLLAVLTASDRYPKTLAFVGDVMLARNVEYLMLKKGSNYPFSGIKMPATEQGLKMIGNFEAAVPSIHKTTKNNKIKFSVSSSMLSTLKEAGFTHLSLANNHSLDFGYKDFLHTNEQLKENGLEVFGQPDSISNQSVTFIELENIVVAMIALHTLHQEPTEEELTKVLAYASRASDFQVVYVHWGTEYDSYNSKSQRQQAELMVQAGADLIIGHHPHVVQNIDFIDGVPVFYSLGNYIFDQYFSTEVQEGLLVKLNFSDGLRLDLLPVSSIGTLSQPNFMSDSKQKTFLQSLANRSNSELKHSIERGTIFLDSVVATSSKIAMIVK